jgi:hypothetical protein
LTRLSAASTLYWFDPTSGCGSTLHLRLPATPAPHHCPVQHRSDHLCNEAESLIIALSDEAAVVGDATTSSLELIADGYAHVLALDVERLRLERQIARLAESGDPAIAAQLRELSMLLRSLTRTSEKLRDALSALRARAELGG